MKKGEVLLPTFSSDVTVLVKASQEPSWMTKSSRGNCEGHKMSQRSALSPETRLPKAKSPCSSWMGLHNKAVSCTEEENKLILILFGYCTLCIYRDIR